MLRNWYAVYTRPQKERKLIAVLNKKNIENFCPLVSVKEGRGEYIKQSKQPLFNSLVFVHVPAEAIQSILSLPCVSTIAYWKSQPAVIGEDEIKIVRQLTETYSEIRLEKSAVEMGKQASIIERPEFEFNEKTVSIKYKSVKASLPSLGFIITAEGIKQKSQLVYEQQGLFNLFPKKINSLFFN